MWTTLIPQPVLSGVLLVTWLMLMNSVEPGQVLLGGLFGWLIPLLTHRSWPRRQSFRRPRKALRLLLVVLWDILLANLVVARLVIGPRANIRPSFVWYPLTLSDEYPISVLSSIITLTPGTLVVDAGAKCRLLIHCLNCDDEAALINQIKTRYETPLQEIFSCSQASSPRPSQ